MSLDLTKIATQANAMVLRLKEGRVERQHRLQYAQQVFSDEAIDLEKLKKKIALSRTTWLVAELTEGLGKRYPQPSVLVELTCSPLMAPISMLTGTGQHAAT